MVMLAPARENFNFPVDLLQIGRTARPDHEERMVREDVSGSDQHSKLRFSDQSTMVTPAWHTSHDQ